MGTGVRKGLGFGALVLWGWVPCEGLLSRRSMNYFPENSHLFKEAWLSVKGQTSLRGRSRLPLE